VNVAPAGVTPYTLSFQPRPELQLFIRDPSEVVSTLEAFATDTQALPVSEWHAELGSPAGNGAISDQPYKLPAVVVLPHDAANGKYVQIDPVVANAFLREAKWTPWGARDFEALGPDTPIAQWAGPAAMFGANNASSLYGPSIKAIWNRTLPACSISNSIQPLLGSLMTGASTAASGLGGGAGFPVDALPLLSPPVFTSLPLALFVPFLLINAPDTFSKSTLTLDQLTVTTFMKHSPTELPGDGLATGILLGGRLLVDAALVDVQSKNLLIDFMYEYSFRLTEENGQLPGPGFLTLEPNEILLSVLDADTLAPPTPPNLVAGVVTNSVRDFLSHNVPGLVQNRSVAGQGWPAPDRTDDIRDPKSEDFLCEPLNGEQLPANADNSLAGDCKQAAELLSFLVQNGWDNTHPPDERQIDTTLQDTIFAASNWRCRWPTNKERQTTCKLNLGNRGRCQFKLRMKSVYTLPDEVRLVPFDTLDDTSFPGVALFYATLQALSGFDPYAVFALCNPPPKADHWYGYFTRFFATADLHEIPPSPAVPKPECTTDKQCYNGQVCGPYGACVDRTCGCTKDSDCIGWGPALAQPAGYWYYGQPTCNKTTGQCVFFCTSDADCPSDHPICNPFQLCGRGACGGGAVGKDFGHCLPWEYCDMRGAGDGPGQCR
jgi:hypothetical protein